MRVRWRTFKTRVFARWARKERVTDRALLELDWTALKQMIESGKLLEVIDG